jgi:hypothetical protein
VTGLSVALSFLTVIVKSNVDFDVLFKTGHSGVAVNESPGNRSWTANDAQVRDDERVAYAGAADRRPTNRYCSCSGANFKFRQLRYVARRALSLDAAALHPHEAVGLAWRPPNNSNPAESTINAPRTT